MAAFFFNEMRLLLGILQSPISVISSRGELDKKRKYSACECKILLHRVLCAGKTTGWEFGAQWHDILCVSFTIRFTIEGDFYEAKCIEQWRSLLINQYQFY